MKKCVVSILACLVLATSIPVGAQNSDPPRRSNNGQRQYTREEIRRLEGEQRRAREERRTAQQNITAADTRVANAEGRVSEAESNLQSFRQANRVFTDAAAARLSGDQREEYQELRNRVSAAQRDVTTQTGLRDAARLELQAAQEAEREAVARLETAEANNCDDCNRSQNDQRPSQVTSIFPAESTTAQILRQVMPGITQLGVAGIGAYTGLQAVNQQSRDYSAYLNSCTSLGLPCQANNGYGGTLAAAMGPSMWGMAAMSGYGAGMIGYGAGYAGYGYGMPYMGAGAGLYMGASMGMGYGVPYAGVGYGVAYAGGGYGAYPGYPYAGAAAYPGAAIFPIGAPYAGGSFAGIQAGIGIGAGAYPGAYPGAYMGAAMMPGYPAGAMAPGFQYGYPGIPNPYMSPYNSGIQPYGYGGLQGYNPYLQQSAYQTQVGMQAFYQQQQANYYNYAMLQQQLQSQVGVASARLQDAQSYYQYSVSMLQAQNYNGYTAAGYSGYGYGYGATAYPAGGMSYTGVSTGFRGGSTGGMPTVGNYSGYNYGAATYGATYSGTQYPAIGVSYPGTVMTGTVTTGTVTTGTGSFPRR